MAASIDPALALRALTLLGQWTRLARGHVGVTACIACSCTASFADIPIADLEGDLLDHLRERHAGVPEVAALLAGDAVGPGGRLGALLRAVAQGEAAKPPLPLDRLLADIARWMEGVAALAR